VDVLIETKLSGEDAIIIVHFEAQAKYQKNFEERMFLYFSQEPDSFKLTFQFKEILRFQYYTVVLRKKNWRDFIKHSNPVAAALLSKMRYNKSERVHVKMEFLRMLLRMKLDLARIHLITGFFDTYLVLNDIEERQLQEEIQRLDPIEEEKIMELKTNWEKTAELRGELKGKLEGKLEGKIQGKIEGEKKILKKFIQAHFGEASKGMLEQVACLTDLDILDHLTDQLFRNSDIEVARRLVNEAYDKQQ
jgi:putative sterol carrier protein